MPQPTPRRRSAPPPPPEEPPKSMALQLTLIGVVTLIGVGIALWAFVFSKEEEKPLPPPPPASKKIESKPKPKPSGPVVKELPEDVRKEIYNRLASYSDQVDKFEKEEAAVDAKDDPNEKIERYRKLHEDYSGLADGIMDTLDDPKYAVYRKDEAYGPSFAGYENRLKFYTVKMNSLKKKEGAMMTEIQQAKIKAESKEAKKDG